MSRVKEELLHAEEDAERAAWEASPEGRAEKEQASQVQAAVDADRARRERAWASKYPAELREWERIQPLFTPTFVFGGDNTFDFDAFLMEVGPAPSPAHRVVRKAKALPYQQGNLRWRAARPSKARSSTGQPKPRAKAQTGGDFLTKQEVADRLQVSTRTVSRWRSEGLLKEFRRGNVLRFKREDVESFEAKGRGGRR